MVDQMKAELTGVAEPTRLSCCASRTWPGRRCSWKFRKISGSGGLMPTYEAYRRADAGDVPMSVIYDLADKHAEKVGMYFHETSRQALAEGFNSMVNRRLPALSSSQQGAGYLRAEVLGRCGASPRPRTWTTPISSVLPISSEGSGAEPTSIGLSPAGPGN